jgi:hypothetical protein
MSEWCQNKKCPEKRNQGQIRGSKGAKYYQSNKANTYIGYWCSNGCREQWWNEHKTTCMNAVGFIDKQTIPIEDAWIVRTQWDYNSVDGSHRIWQLENKLMGVYHSITREQALKPNTDSDWDTINNPEARELAITLGLAS